MGSQWPKRLNECQYQLEALHSGVLAKTASSERGQEFTMYHHQDYILSHGRRSEPRTSRGQWSYKDKRCRQRSRKYETGGVAEERLTRIWPGPTAGIARHHHCAEQLPEACCSSSVVSGPIWNITGISSQHIFTKISGVFQHRQMTWTDSYKSTQLLWNEHQLIPPTRATDEWGSSFCITAKCDGLYWWYEL